ncbi:amino acid ABC transporter permease (plasmid) [Photobacterium sp. DA100]|uniref:amino acid ABC transporter permease n=1 Tax=Photobacterium sp. DA100 TaxID=3027472 RepID=UPI00247A6F91|nr:amino acid ABC transporter permease [Photobacterium sp. DA100]WEM45219.1 amino acid ABC transporter permease [Photobacterium sp. DA100]
MKVFHFSPSEAPPSKMIGISAWLRENLFSSALNTLITGAIAGVIFAAVTSLFQWAFLDADWVGLSREDCGRDGACWVFVQARFDQFMFGFYPSDESWRPMTFMLGLAATIAVLLLGKGSVKKAGLVFALTVFPVLSVVLLYGGLPGLPVVETHLWGGLLITLVIALTGIVVSLPLGVVLALGRRSSMPIVRSMSTVYIEFWRGVPLITVLFMASVMLPLFLSGGTEIDKLIRALIGVVLFNAAYMAEAIRGGLQSIPKGQFEAAEALGLSYWKSTRLIILPQALKISIPSIVNTFIALLKDTSLVLIIGMFDVLGIAQSANSDPAWLGFSTESFVFAALVFWIMCFGMSRYSIYLEGKLNTGHSN